MIQNERDRKYNSEISQRFGLNTPESAEKVYNEVKQVWESQGFTQNFEEMVESCVRTVLSMNIETGLPLTQALYGCLSHAFVVGFKVAQQHEENKQKAN